jgi:pimeloyl-ACP methyl ester carboxylesterase
MGTGGQGVRKALIVPGAAVRRYVLDAVEALSAVGIWGEVLAAPGEPMVPADLGEYGRALAGRIAGGVDVLIGLSVGAQVAAVAAAAQPHLSLTRSPAEGAIRRLVLISPTVDPAARSGPRLVGRWVAGGRVEPMSLLAQQLPDWRRAGSARIATVVRSAREIAIEQLLPGVSCPVTVVHAERDVITSHAYAAHLAAAAGGDLVIVPGATHSWPYDDPARFAALIDRLIP